MQIHKNVETICKRSVHNEWRPASNMFQLQIILKTNMLTVVANTQ
jgi:hypothetical protein